MSGQYSGSYSNSIVVTAALATLESNLSIPGGLTIAVYAGTSTGTLINDATITGGFSNLDTFGIILEDSTVTFTNAASGTIAANNYAVGLRYGNGSIQNAGTIEAFSTQSVQQFYQGIFAGGIGVIVNQAAGATTITNEARGLIYGAYSGIIDLAPRGAAASIDNAGTVGGGHTTLVIPQLGTRFDTGIAADTARVTNETGGSVSGFVGVSGYRISVANHGLISANDIGVFLDRYGYASNSGTITAGSIGVQEKIDGTIVNAGLIQGNATGVVLGYVEGGILTHPSLTNLAGGTIDGAGIGLDIRSVHHASVINDGLIESSGGIGVQLLASASIQNAGIITGPSGLAETGYAAYYSSIYTGLIKTQNSVPVILTNTGTIQSTSTSAAYGVMLKGVATIRNSGLIEGGARGVAILPTKSINVPGYIANTGTITVASTAVAGVVLNTGGTVVNGGSIAAGVYASVVFNDATVASRLIVDPGATFGGPVIANGKIGNIVELAAGTGTIADLGQYRGFGALQIDPGANWTIDPGSFAGGVTILGGSTLHDHAIITTPTTTAYAVSLASGGYLANFSTIDGGDRAVGAANAAGTIFNAGLIEGGHVLGVQLDSGGTLINAGTITGGYYAAVVFNDASVADRMVLDIGSRINGRVLAHGTTGNVLELTDNFILGYGGPGGNTTVYGLGTGITGFNIIQVDNAAHWTLAAGAGNNFTGGVSLGISSALTSDISIAGSVTGLGADSLQNQGQITAATGAAYAIDFTNSGAVVNSGTIAGGQRAVGIDGTYGLVSNTGLIEGGAVVGVALRGGGTLVNAGTIIGGSYGAAVFNDAAAADRLIIDPGASFSGQVLAHSTVSAVIELGSATSHGTLAGFSSYTGNFNSLAVDAGAHWEINGAFTGGVSLGAGAYLGDFATLSVGTEGVTIGAGAKLLGTEPITAAANAAYAVELQGGYLGILRGQVTGGERVIGDQIAPGTILNSGIIEGGNVVGIQLGAGGSVNNGGTILGGYYAAIAAAARATISNSYIINAGTARAGAIRLNAGGVVDNTGAAASIIGGAQGVAIYGAPGTVINSGTISGTVTGVVLAAGGTVTNAGSIAAGSYAAIAFGAATDRLIVDPGARFGGRVLAHSTVASTLEFAAGSGTLSGIGSSFAGFSTLQFDPGATWTAAGTYTAFDSGQTIENFAADDTLVLDGFAATSHTYVSGVGLELGNAAGNQITLDIPGTYLTGNFIVTDPPGNTTISVVPCFCAGTRILLRRGEIPVDDVREGDIVILANGNFAPITWIGHRMLDCTRHPNPEQILPVLIEASAIATGIPCRDLYLSPDHALLLGNRLIPAKTLINGHTIRQVNRRSITYYHIELATHAALLAEATPAESYLDTSNRGAFANAGTPTLLHPDLAQTLREAESFAPFADSGPVVETVRRRILARANIATTTDPDLTISYLKDGAAIIKSRSGIPGHLSPDPRDRRILESVSLG